MSDLEKAWLAFLSKHSYWWRRFGGEGPEYCLPAEVIEGLSEGRAATGNSRARVPLIGREDAEAEHAFLSFCSHQHAPCVGGWIDQTLEFPLLNGPDLDVDRLVEQSSLAGWDRYLKPARLRSVLSNWSFAKPA